MRQWQSQLLDLKSRLQNDDTQPFRWIWVIGKHGRREGKTFLAEWLQDNEGFVSMPQSAFQHPRVLNDAIDRWQDSNHAVIDFGSCRDDKDLPYEQISYWWTSIQRKNTMTIVFSEFEPEWQKLPVAAEQVFGFRLV